MAKTLEAIKAYAANPDAIVASGEMADMRFKTGETLSLRAAKLFHLLVQAAGVAVADAKQHRMTFASLNESFHASLDELENLADELHSAVLKLRLTDQNGRTYTKSGPIISDLERDDDTLPQAELRFEFSPSLRRAIQDSTHWAVISRKAVLAFESKYTLRLYAALSLRTGLRKTSEAFLLDDFREMLGVPAGSYPRWNNFRQFVLSPAIAELNQLAGFIVGYTPLQHGKKIIGVKLTWGVKDGAARIEALKELEASKVGRKARRKGQVEYVAEAERMERQEISLALSKLPAQAPHTDDV